MSKELEDLLLSLRQFRQSMDRVANQGKTDSETKQVAREASDWLGRYEYSLIRTGEKSAKKEKINALIRDLPEHSRAIETLALPLQATAPLNAKIIQMAFQTILAMLPDDDEIEGIPFFLSSAKKDNISIQTQLLNVVTHSNQLTEINRVTRAISHHSIGARFNVLPKGLDFKRGR